MIVPQLPQARPSSAVNLSMHDSHNISSSTYDCQQDESKLLPSFAVVRRAYEELGETSYILAVMGGLNK